MFDYFGWIVEAKIRDGKQDDFKNVVAEIVHDSSAEEGTLNYQYFVSAEGDVLVLERFCDIASADQHIDTWEKYADRWVAAAEPTRMVHLGQIPDQLRERHAALAPKLLGAFAGFEKR